MLTVSLCRITLPQTLQANSSNKLFPFPWNMTYPVRHMPTHTCEVSAVTGHACSAPKASLLLSSACWPSEEKYTQPFLLCYFTESCSHPSVRVSSRGGMVLSEGSKLSITHFFSAAERGFWKYRKNQQAGCTSAAPDTEPKYQHTYLHAKWASRCVHCITKLTLFFHQFLKLISISSQQTQLKDSDIILPWKETGD